MPRVGSGVGFGGWVTATLNEVSTAVRAELRSARDREWAKVGL